ncbi:putative glycosidase C21B10.07 [Cladophialophora carrionii]|uniref:Putative glycosidase C21B10.07 n=1 Tax=Cladophialophora carrionii TaxID=86049 RepID=A0A1C1C7T3_9EURO|nr:putative glycosidase C21B10.07 [Cladophialophora carrionii]
MRPSTLVSALLAGGARGLSNYQPVGNYSGVDFFRNFQFFSDPDPTAGFVKYVDQDVANSTGLAGIASGDQFKDLPYLGLDYSSVAQAGRPSTRIESQNSFNSSTLWVTDIRHHPGGVCGVWSAYWLVGPNWPWGGEIDLLENINLATTNKYVLHTGANLAVSNLSDPTTANSTGMNIRGHFSNLNCSAASEGNVGCVVEGQNNTFGTEFNANGGGVIALEYLPEAISVWQFARTEIPGDIFNGSPTPSTWRRPDAHFMATDGSSLEDYFYSLRTVFNTNICGSWIDKVWQTSECAALAPSCAAYAAQNPAAFKDAYWLIGGVQVYEAVASDVNATALPEVPAANLTSDLNNRGHVRRFSRGHVW